MHRGCGTFRITETIGPRANPRNRLFSLGLDFPNVALTLWPIAQVSPPHKLSRLITVPLGEYAAAELAGRISMTTMINPAIAVANAQLAAKPTRRSAESQHANRHKHADLVCVACPSRLVNPRTPDTPDGRWAGSF